MLSISGRVGDPSGISYVNKKGEKKQEYDFTGDYTIVSVRDMQACLLHTSVFRVFI